jgi:hypothetical protein
MKLTFPNGEHADVELEPGELVLGSGVGSRVTLPASGLSGKHLQINRDRRGMCMKVLADGASVFLNARPVRKLAWLRAGDLVCVGQVKVELSESDPQVIERNIPPNPPAVTETMRLVGHKVVLRGLTGSHHGRSYSLTEPRTLGRSAAADIRFDDPSMAERHAALELHEDHVVLRALDPKAVTFVNGVSVRDAVLANGDLLVIDQHRFVLEAPGLPPRGQHGYAKPTASQHTQTFQAIKTPAPAPRSENARPEPETEPAGDDGSTGLWWLICAAAVLAAALTALLYYNPSLGG